MMEGSHLVELNSMLERARRNTLGDVLARTRARMPDKIALAYRGRHVTYEGLDHLVNQTAHQFLQDGMEKGDMVTVMSKNSLDFVIVKFALARMGAVRSEEHTSELQSRGHLVCRLLLKKKNKTIGPAKK